MISAGFGFCSVCITSIAVFIALLCYMHKYLKYKNFENLVMFIWSIIVDVYLFSFLYYLNKTPIYNTYDVNGELIQIYVLENSSNFMFGYAYEISYTFLALAMVVIMGMVLLYQLDKIGCGE